MTAAAVSFACLPGAALAGTYTWNLSSTFLIVSAPNVIGSAVSLSRRGAASVQIVCLAPAGTTCSGTVLVLTTRTFQPVPGGPVGHLQVLFAYVRIPAGRTLTVSRSVSRAVARALRRSAPMKLRVSASLSAGGGRPSDGSVLRPLRLR